MMTPENARAELTMAAINNNWWVQAGNRTVTFLREYQGVPHAVVTVWDRHPASLNWEVWVGAEIFRGIGGGRSRMDAGTFDPVVARNWLIDFGERTRP